MKRLDDVIEELKAIADMARLDIREQIRDAAQMLVCAQHTLKTSIQTEAKPSNNRPETFTIADISQWEECSHTVARHRATTRVCDGTYVLVRRGHKGGPSLYAIAKQNGAPHEQQETSQSTSVG